MSLYSKGVSSSFHGDVIDVALKYGGISFTTSFLLRMLLMLIASIRLLANGIWRNFLLLS
jgi:hypothetical protein